jgi:hypothetical protein
MTRDFLSVLAIFKNEADNLGRVDLALPHRRRQHGRPRARAVARRRGTCRRRTTTRPSSCSACASAPGGWPWSTWTSSSSVCRRARRRGEGQQVGQERRRPAGGAGAARSGALRLRRAHAAHTAGGAGGGGGRDRPEVVYFPWRMFGSRDDPRHPFGAVRTSYVWRAARLNDSVKGVVLYCRARRWKTALFFFSPDNNTPCECARARPRQQ